MHSLLVDKTVELVRYIDNEYKPKLTVTLDPGGLIGIKTRDGVCEDGEIYGIEQDMLIEGLKELGVL